jgi:hypothetical protein
MNRPAQICAVSSFFVMTTVLLWSQASKSNQVSQEQSPEQQIDNTAPSDSSGRVSSHPEDEMQTPPPVAAQSYPMVFASEGRANYLRYGLSFTTAYMDNVPGGYTATPVSDVSYSVAPVIAIDARTSRLHWVATYAPGFTFYQRVSGLNEADHNVSLEFTYRLSPHVKFTAQDALQKSSNVFNQGNLGSTVPISGAAQVPNTSVIPPIANHISNTGSVGLTYQFSLNGMIGVTGSFTYLDYPNPSQVPGLFNSRSQAGSAFYTHRISKMHYIGATYQYQRLLSYLTEGRSETQTHAALFFYTLYPASHFSISFFGGPQRSDTSLPPLTSSQPSLSETSWNPAAGASLSWQGRLTSLALSYSHLITAGGGLGGAVSSDSVSAAIRRQIAKRLSGSVDGGYVQNQVIAQSIPGGENGHSILGTASMQQALGEHLNVQLGYTRLHQSYPHVAILSSTPDTNREFISISYQFVRPLGR